LLDDLRNTRHLTLCFFRFTFIATFLLIGGCAADRAYQEGTAAIAAGNYRLGLSKLGEAATLAPDNIQYRSTLLSSKERAMQQLVQRADDAKNRDDLAEARKLYVQALQVEPGNANVKSRLTLLASAEQHSALLAEAKSSAPERQRELLEQILSQNPKHADALTLHSQLDAAAAPSPAAYQLSEAFRKRIKLELEEASLRQIFALLGRASDLNFVFDREIKMDQRSSILLKDTTIEAALYYTLLTNQLESQVLDNNTVLIYPNSAAKQKDYQELILRTFHLSYASPQSVANYLRTFVKSKDIGVDEKLNLVTIRDNADAIKLAEKLVALQDVPEPEVMLEVEVLEVNRTRLLDLGVNWPQGVTLTPIASSATGLTAKDLLHNLNPSTLGAAVGPMTIKAQKQDTEASILANPRIRVRNREKARVMVGERVPNITSNATATGIISESINYVDVGLKLDVEPTISLDNDVAIRVALEVSSIVTQLQTKAGSTAFQLGTRNATTMLSLRDGETQILAGLINDQDRSDASKIPLLGEIPLLGRLFGTRADNGQRTEIVLSITPHLIRNIRRPTQDLSSIRSGTEASFRSRPMGVPTKGEPNQTAAAANRPAVAEQAPANALKWLGPATTNADEPFTLALAMRGGAAPRKLNLVVQFDPKQLQLVNVAESDFMRQRGAPTTFDSAMNVPGNVEITLTRKSTDSTTIDGVIAELSWKALGHGIPVDLKLLKASAEMDDGRMVELDVPPPQRVQLR
jgi:general secretion pathway protein D